MRWQFHSFTSSDFIKLCLLWVCLCLKMKICLMPWADKHTHTHSAASSSCTSSPRSHCSTQVAWRRRGRGIRRGGRAADLCVFDTAQRAECVCALTGGEKIHAQMDFQGWGGLNHVSFGRGEGGLQTLYDTSASVRCSELTLLFLLCSFKKCMFFLQLWGQTCKRRRSDLRLFPNLLQPNHLLYLEQTLNMII